MLAGRGYDLEKKRREANVRDDGQVPQLDLGKQRSEKYRRSGIGDVRRKSFQGKKDDANKGPVLAGIRAKMQAQPQVRPPQAAPQISGRPPGGRPMAGQMRPPQMRPPGPPLAMPPGMPQAPPGGIRQARRPIPGGRPRAGQMRPPMQAAGALGRPMPGGAPMDPRLQQLLARAGGGMPPQMRPPGLPQIPMGPQRRPIPQGRPAPGMPGRQRLV